jgi:muramoyltetrapeptide carboxypeptidase LdcA involved in peptidoglycan recycling
LQASHSQALIGYSDNTSSTVSFGKQLSS